MSSFIASQFFRMRVFRNTPSMLTNTRKLWKGGAQSQRVALKLDFIAVVSLCVHHIKPYCSLFYPKY